MCVCVCVCVCVYSTSLVVMARGGMLLAQMVFNGRLQAKRTILIRSLQTGKAPGGVGGSGLKCWCWTANLRSCSQASKESKAAFLTFQSSLSLRNCHPHPRGSYSGATVGGVFKFNKLNFVLTP